jgi:hypothetical protein
MRPPSDKNTVLRSRVWLLAAACLFGCSTSSDGGGYGAGAYLNPQYDADPRFGDAAGGGLDTSAGTTTDAAAGTTSDAAVTGTDGGNSDAAAAADTNTCAPNCAGLACGDDGCGGSCGTCPTGEACVVGGTCQKLAPTDLCKDVQCDPNAYCIEEDGKAACVCKLRWEGTGKSCKDVDECKVDNGGCDENAFCANQMGAAPVCSCQDGFTGNGVKCIDVDECKTGAASCGTGATCVNTAGSWECACEGGYAKLGNGCVDVDECAVAKPPCDAHATCTNTPGSYSCACNLGYKGNGYVCSQDNDCGGACDNNASCKPVPGQPPVCVCNVGFSGSGSTCFPIPSTVTLHTINITPFDPDDNKTWDGNAIPEKDRLEFEKLLKSAAEAYVSGNYVALLPAVASLAGFLSSITSPPDPYGTVKLSSQGKLVGSFSLPKIGNTLNPSWSGVEWKSVTVDASTTLEIDLYDSDAVWDDVIGKANVSGGDLMAALAFGKVLPVNVSTQGKKGIAFVQVLVTPAYVCGNGQCDDASGETKLNCPADCGGTTSGGGGGGGHFCDANCGGGNGLAAPNSCFCDADCKQYNDCCDALGSGPGGASCAGASCALCK